MYEKILLATDGSDDALRAAGRAIEFQKKWNSKVVIFHSIEHHSFPEKILITAPLAPTAQYTVPVVDYNRIKMEYRDAGKKVLEETKKMFAQGTGKVETRLIEDEDPEDYIKRITDEEDFDLVVLGCKGEHSKLKNVFMGSVATKALNEAACDVLIVR